MKEKPRILILLPPAYRWTDAFEAAARKIDVDLLFASDAPETFPARTMPPILKLPYHALDKLIESARQLHHERPFAAAIGVDNETVWLAALIADTLDLTHNPIPTLEALRFKHLSRQKLLDAGLPIPRFFQFSIQDDPERLAQLVPYPCILKPTFLSGTRGVFPSKNEREFLQAFQQIREIVSRAPERRRAGRHGYVLLVEDYIEGREILVEGYVQNREVKILQMLDRFADEDALPCSTVLYTSPSRLPFSYQQLVERLLDRTVSALGISRGPILARFRINARGVWILDISPTSLYGPGTQLLRFPENQTFEELMLRELMGEPILFPDPLPEATGMLALMAPQPARVMQIDGVEAARQVKGIEAVVLLSRPDQPAEPRCLGFILARGKKPDQVETSLRRARQLLHFQTEA
ncbi:MAG: ATP-grasp domain-containing protein [Calditrichaeota bacterium]|nr:ATP-grasp domain-containing protein [Calditrichota bacterium]